MLKRAARNQSNQLNSANLDEPAACALEWQLVARVPVRSASC
jgi:hypothetical protein